MKKTIIALAALAATGATFAQSVTLSGKFGVSYIKQSSTAGRNVPNFAVTDGDIRFVATEDLGGGLRAGADIEIRVRGRGTVDDAPSATGACTTTGTPAVTTCPISGTSGIGARNATASLSGGFGSVVAGAIELPNGLKSRAWAGAPIGIAFALEARNGGGPLSSAANTDYLQYTTPELVPGVRAAYVRVDDIGNTGQSGGRPGINADAIQLFYKQGPIDAFYDYTLFDYNSGNGNKRERHRLSASVDFGVAAVGLGYEDNKQDGTLTYKPQYTAGVKVPLGAITLGAVYASAAKQVDLNKTNAAEGYGVGVQYDFSKRTNINFTWLDHGGATAPGGTAAQLATVDRVNREQYQLRLMHSF